MARESKQGCHLHKPSCNPKEIHAEEIRNEKADDVTQKAAI